MKASLQISSTLFALTLLLAPIVSAQSGWTWQPVESGTTQNLNAISMLNKDFGVAVGENRTILSWNGSVWTAMSGTEDTGYNAVTALNTVAVINNNLVLVGAGTGSNDPDKRGLSVWNGASWSPKINASAGGNSLTGIWTDRNGLIVRSSSYATRIARYDGDNVASSIATESNWSMAYNAGVSTPSLNAIDGAGGDSLFAAGIGGTVMFSSNDGETWTNISSPVISAVHWYSIEVLSATSAWIGGVDSHLAYWNGSVWSDEVVRFNGNTVTWRDILALDENNIWAVGTRGAVKYYNGEVWSDVLLPSVTTSTTFTSIAYDGSSIWITGSNGLIYQAIPEPSTAALGAASLLVTLLWRGKTGQR